MSDSLHEPKSQDTIARLVCATVSLLLFSSCAHIDSTRLNRLSLTEQERCIAEDVKALQIYREGLAKIVTWAEGQTTCFPWPTLSRAECCALCRTMGAIPGSCSFRTRTAHPPTRTIRKEFSTSTLNFAWITTH